MKRWKNVNAAIKNVLTEDEFTVNLEPFREELQRHIKGSEKNRIKSAYRTVRAEMLSDFRFHLALLDAAAHEEQLVEK